MVLAYVFWHQPRAEVETDRYERALRLFRARLVTEPVPGLLGCWSVRTPELAWLPGGGYEDWYLVTDFVALGHLNAGAVDAGHAAAHDPIAHAAGFGVGALYAAHHGDPHRRDAERAWFTKPDGTSYEQFHADLVAPSADDRDDRDAERVTWWQRQLVLGPAPEYCRVGPQTATTASGWRDPLVRSVGTLLD